MKKLNYLVLFALILLSSCKTELDSLQEERHQNTDLKISFIKNNEILKNKDLICEITKIQSEKLQGSRFSKTSQDSILSDAIIDTENVMLVEEGNKKTYTFPVKRNSSSKIENLVLKKNTDNTYNGILIHYNLTADEKALMNEGHYVDLTKKVQFFDINNLKINQKITTAVINCYQITWETGVCASGQHGYGDASCTLTGSLRAGEPTIISITDTCGGGSNSSTGNDPNFPGSTGEPTGNYNTSPYTGSFEDYQAYLLEINRVFRLKLSSSQLSWYDSHKTIAMELAKLYHEDNSIAHLTFLKSIIDYMKASDNVQDTLLFANIIDFLKQDSSYHENWNLINNILNEHNPNLGIEILNFIKENPDTLNRAEIITRIKNLDNALAQNPNLLLDIPCGELPRWQELAMHPIPQSVKNKIFQVNGLTGWFKEAIIQNLDYSNSFTINMDVYPVKISSMPEKSPGTKYTPAEFFDYFRKNINDFTDINHGKFYPVVAPEYNINDTQLWSSNNPLGSLITIKIPADNGTVVCSGWGSQAWIFTTVKSPWDNEHPVSGNRLFGYFIDESGNMVIYTRGVDRFTTKFSNNAIQYIAESFGYSEAKKMWENMQQKVTSFVNSKKGNSSVITGTEYTPNFIFVKDYLKNKKPLSALGCH